MADVYSTQLLSSQGLTGTETITGDDGYVTVITELDGYNGNTISTLEVTLQLLGIAGQVIAQLDFGSILLTPKSLQWQGRYALKAGQSVHVTAHGGGLDASVFGYKLYAP